MNAKLICAITNVGDSYPAFINVSHTDSRLIRITVRSEGNGGRDVVAMDLTPGQMNILAAKSIAALHDSAPTSKVTDDMVSRFLGWKLPKNFYPDCYVSFDREKASQSPHSWPTGTNLLTADQARAMLEHVIGVPDQRPKAAEVAPTTGETAPGKQLDDQFEAEIVAKGLTAPRVTPADIEANIVAGYWFTAKQATEGGPQHDSLALLTFCVIVLRNGYTVTGQSACASPENFDEELGRKIARADAVRQVWPLMGYALRERLAQGGAA